ncbi:MAG TPA: hypothetical protein VFO19_07310 [Vicinamibacterales bacterium]|nr:hypothetical protein [Vicinamibacterales bacterium]
MKLRATLVWMTLVTLCAAANAQGQAPVQVNYHLPKTTVVVKGTIVTKKTFQQDGSLQPSSEPTGTSVSLVTGPEYAARTMTLESSALAKTDTTVSLTTKGTLAGLNRTSEGQLGAIVKNIFGSIVSLAGAFGGRPFSLSGGAEALYEQEHGDLAALRRTLKTNLNATVARLGELATQLAKEADFAKAKQITDHMSLLDRHVKTLRHEADLLDTHFNAWRTRKEAKVEQTLELMIDADQLPIDAPIKKLSDDGSVIDPNNFSQSGEFAPIAKRFRLVVTRLEPEMPKVPVPSGASNRVFYRAVRPVILRLYQITEDAKLVHVRDSQEYIVGERSEVMTLDLPTTKWSKRGIEVQFTDNALTKFGATQSSGVADTAEAVRQLSGEYLTALKQVNEIEAERRKLATVDIDRQIDEVKKQKDLFEAQVALGQAVNLEEAKSQLASLDLQVKTLEAQRTVAVGVANAGQIEGLTAQQQLLKLQNDLLKAQLEQIQLQRQLNGGGGQ